MQTTLRGAARPCAARRQSVARRSAVRCRAESGPQKWPQQFQYLVSNRLKSISPEECGELAGSGQYVIVDVRPGNIYAKSRIAGAVNVPMYQELSFAEGNPFLKALKFVAYAANGVAPIELNPTFNAQVIELSAGGQKGLIMVCEAGGTMKPSVNFPQGKASRSLQAAFKAMSEAGVTKVSHMERGVYGWWQSEMEFEGPEDYKPDVGRTPSAAAEPTLQQINSARGYEMRPDDRTNKK